MCMRVVPTTAAEFTLFVPFLLESMYGCGNVISQHVWPLPCRAVRSMRWLLRRDACGVQELQSYTNVERLVPRKRAGQYWAKRLSRNMPKRFQGPDNTRRVAIPAHRPFSVCCELCGCLHAAQSESFFFLICWVENAQTYRADPLLLSLDCSRIFLIICFLPIVGKSAGATACVCVCVCVYTRLPI